MGVTKGEESTIGDLGKMIHFSYAVLSFLAWSAYQLGNNLKASG